MFHHTVTPTDQSDYTNLHVARTTSTISMDSSIENGALGKKSSQPVEHDSTLRAFDSENEINLSQLHCKPATIPRKISDWNLPDLRTDLDAPPVYATHVATDEQANRQTMTAEALFDFSKNEMTSWCPVGSFEPASLQEAAEAAAMIVMKNKNAK